MNKLFEDAKFGTRYLTRNGQMAVYLYSGRTFHSLVTPQEFGVTQFDVDDDGYIDTENPKVEDEKDIVGHWKENVESAAYEYSNNISDTWWEESMKRFKSLPLVEQQKYRQFIGFNDFCDVLLNKLADAYKEGYKQGCV